MALRFKSMDEVPAHLRGAGALAPVKRSKYGGEPVELDGYRFDSKFEARRYQELVAMESVGLITGLNIHPSYALHVRGVRIGALVPDFVYQRDGETVVEDTKSPATARKELYVWKKSHFEIEYGLKISEVIKQRRRR